MRQLHMQGKSLRLSFSQICPWIPSSSSGDCEATWRKICVPSKFTDTNFSTIFPNISLLLSSSSLAILFILSSPQVSISVSPSLSLLLSLFLFLSPQSLMEHVFQSAPCSYAWDGKGAQPGDCVMFTVPGALGFPAPQDLLCYSGSVGPDTLPQHPLTTLFLSLSHRPRRVFF